MSDWVLRLRQASFRGVSFGVFEGDAQVGRRVAVHEYPGRDEPFAEDLGRSARRFGLRGFLIEDSFVYGGGDVLAQRQAMEAAAEAEGPGTLIHPTKGRLSVQLLTCGISERVDLGRVFELRFDFIEAGQRLFPGLTVATGGLLGQLTSALDQLASGSLPGPVATLLAATGTLGAFGSVQAFAQGVQAIAGDAGGVLGLGATVSSGFGRYAGARGAPIASGGLASASAALSGATLSTLPASARALLSTVTGATDPSSAIRLADELRRRLT